MMEREYLLCRIVSDLVTVNGRKRFQKMMYIAKALGYRVPESFVWGNYGVYSQELQRELDDLVTKGMIDQSTCSLGSPEYRYEITRKGSDFLCGLAEIAIRNEAVRNEEGHRLTFREDDDPAVGIGNEDIDSLLEVLQQLNERTATELELWSSILYLQQTEKNEDNLVSFLKYLKPKFKREEEIRQGILAVGSLRSKGILRLSSEHRGGVTQ